MSDNTASKKVRRTPGELAAYHRAQADANDARFAAQIDTRVAMASTLLRKTRQIATLLPASYQSELAVALLALATVHKQLVAEAIKDDPDFQVKG